MLAASIGPRPWNSPAGSITEDRQQRASGSASHSGNSVRAAPIRPRRAISRRLGVAATISGVRPSNCGNGWSAAPSRMTSTCFIGSSFRGYCGRAGRRRLVPRCHGFL